MWGLGFVMLQEFGVKGLGFRFKELIKSSRFRAREACYTT